MPLGDLSGTGFILILADCCLWIRGFCSIPLASRGSGLGEERGLLQSLAKRVAGIGWPSYRGLFLFALATLSCPFGMGRLLSVFLAAAGFSGAACLVHLVAVPSCGVRLCPLFFQAMEGGGV